MFEFIKNNFIELLTSIISASNHTKYVFWNALINLNSKERSQGLRYYPLLVNLDRCVGSWKLCSKQNRRFKYTCFQYDNQHKWISKNINKIYDASVNVSLTVANVTQIKRGKIINVGVSLKIRKNIMGAKNILLEILLHEVAKLASI